MKYYKDIKGKPWAYEDNVPDEKIKDGLIAITKEEVEVLLAPTPEEEQIRVYEEWKVERDKAVKEILVTTQLGNVFDGDETSQTRMTRAIQGIQGGFNGTTINWKLADNTVVVVDEAELTEALTLAGLAQESLWFPQ